MKGYTFYRDCGTAQAKNRLRRTTKQEHGVVPSKLTTEGNVIAVFTDQDGFWSGGNYCMECIAAVHTYDNSPVCGSSVSVDYLYSSCILVSDKTARQIHPEMFKYLDS